MSLELSKSGMEPDISVKSGEFSPLGSMTSSEERKKKERIPRNTIVSWLSCLGPNNNNNKKRQKQRESKTQADKQIARFQSLPNPHPLNGLRHYNYKLHKQPQKKYQEDKNMYITTSNHFPLEPKFQHKPHPYFPH